MVKFYSILFSWDHKAWLILSLPIFNWTSVSSFPFSSQGDKGSPGEKGRIVSQTIKMFLLTGGSQILGHPVAMRMCKGHRDPGTPGFQSMCLQQESYNLFVWGVFVCVCCCCFVYFLENSLRISSLFFCIVNNGSSTFREAHKKNPNAFKKMCGWMGLDRCDSLASALGGLSQGSLSQGPLFSLCHACPGIPCPPTWPLSLWPGEVLSGQTPIPLSWNREPQRQAGLGVWEMEFLRM